MPGVQYFTFPPVMGKLIEPSARVADPTTPGVKPRVVRAPVKPASSLTAVLTPVRLSTSAAGAGCVVVAAEELDDIDVPESSFDEHAAKGVSTNAAAATATSDLR